jgi:predicted membrane-bound mannosyltransferase
MFVFTLAVYSWASERMPWLVLHPLLPLVVLAGLGGQMLWRNRDRVIAKVGIAVALLGAVYMLQSAVYVTYVRPADARELLVQVQNATDVPKIRNEIMALENKEKGKNGQPLTMQIDNWGGVGWPWAWYFRDLPAGYYDMSLSSYVPDSQVVLVSDPNHASVAPKLHDYVGRRFTYRVWWVPDWGGASVGDWARWFLWRKPWSPTATMDEWLYVRKDVSAPSA